MIILMAARPFPRLSTDPIIAWTVNGGSTPTTGPITLVKGDAAVLAVDLTVRIMCVAPDLLSIAVCVTASFTAVIASQQAMSIRQNLSQVPGPVYSRPKQTPPVRARQMPRVSGMGAHPGPQVLHSTRGGTRGAEPTEEGGGSMVAPPPPLFVYADFEATQNAGVFVANLFCYSSSEETTIHVLDGEDCALQFLRDLDDLTDTPDSESEREILVVFHNFKGFNGMFILHVLYQQQREVADQLTVGAKVLSFKIGAVKFIDSLCFLPMPLASFPSTFNLTELKKGFFPDLFNTPDHQQYVGRIPDLEFYDPDGMMAKKKDELTHWHADQVRRNVMFNFKQEMIDYCKSDVALLKAGCEAFQQEFERQAAFNPMA